MTAEPLPALTSGNPSAWESPLCLLVEKAIAQAPADGRRATPDAVAVSSRAQPDAREVKPADVWPGFTASASRAERHPQPTVGARIACLFSHFRFLTRMGLVVSNPCDAIERPRATQSVARGPSAGEVRRLLPLVPDTVAGTEERALLLTFILTGRRRTEVIGLTAGDISVEGRDGVLQLRRQGRQARQTRSSRPAYEALCATMADAGLELGSMPKERRSESAPSTGSGIAQSPAKLLAVLVADTEPWVRKVPARADMAATYRTAELRTSSQVARLAHEPMSARTGQLHLLII